MIFNLSFNWNSDSGRYPTDGSDLEDDGSSAASGGNESKYTGMSFPRFDRRDLVGSISIHLSMSRRKVVSVDGRNRCIRGDGVSSHEQSRFGMTFDFL
jgi:hypothetical protein